MEHCGPIGIHELYGVRPKGVSGLLKAYTETDLPVTRTFNCFSIVPVARHIVEDLDGANAPSDASVLPVTIWELGEAAGPIFIGPLSEVAGRYRIINFTNLIFILATALAALSQNNSMFIFSRALTGMAVATNVLNPAIVGDIFPPEERGAAMSFIMFAPLLGGTIGPALSGLLSEALGWRCVLWICVVLASICQLAFFTYFRETYSVVILRRRASKVCKEMGRNSLSYTLAENSSIGDSQVSLWLSIGRPAAVLFGSGVLIAMTVFGSVVFAHIYVLSVTLPGILEDVYGLPSTAVGLVFLAHGEYRAQILKFHAANRFC